MNQNEAPPISLEAQPQTEISSQATGTDNAELLPKDNSIDIDHFSKVELRVGQIVSAEAVPKSKKLLKLQVSLGETLGSRQILSGISQFYSPETLVGKRIVVVANLKPAKLMGIESQGMLLAGCSDDSSVLSLLEVSELLPLGSVVR